MTTATIQPHIHLHKGPGTDTTPRTWTFEDTSTRIYPKLPNGKSICVVIIRRALVSNKGTRMQVCRNAGKWSYKIKYASQSKIRSVTLSKFLAEAKRWRVNVDALLAAA